MERDQEQVLTAVDLTVYTGPGRIGEMRCEQAEVLRRFVLVTASSIAGPGGAQTTFELPRLADGRPDPQGVRDFRTLTPLERAEDRAGQPRLPPEEGTAIETAADRPGSRTGLLRAGGRVVRYNDFRNHRGARVVDHVR